MPTKESTIRLKLVGSSDVTSALQAFNRQARADIYALNRAMKVEDEAKRGNQSDPTIQAATRDAASKRFAAEKRIDETLQVARDSRDKSKWENQRIAERESLKFQLAGMDKIAESEPKLALQVAKMKMAAAELATDKVAQINKKEQEATAASSVAIQRRADAEKAAVAKANRAEDRRGEAEQSGFWLAKMKREGGGAGPAGGEMKGALSGFGGKMILGGAVGTMVGTATGQAQLGSMIGNVTSAALFGNPAMAGMVAGMEVAGSLVQSWRESVKASAQSTAALSGSLLDLTTTWANLGAQINRNPFGKAMEGELARASAAAEKTNQKMFDLAVQPLETGDALMKEFGGKVAKDYQIDMMMKESSLQFKSQLSAKKFRDEEYPKQVANAERLQLLQDKVVATSGMHNSLLKDRTKLEAQSARDRQEREDRFVSEHSQSKAAAFKASERVRDLEAVAGSPYDKKDPLASMAHANAESDLLKARMAKDEAWDKLARLGPQQGRERVAAESEIRDKELGMEEQYYQTRKSLIDESWDSYFKTTQVGYAREEAMFKAHWSRRERDIQASQDPGVRAAFEIDKAQAFAAWEAERARNVESTASSADISALRAVQQRQVGGWKAQGLSDSQIDLLKDKEIRGERVQLDIRSASAMRDYAGAAKMAREEVQYQASFKIHEDTESPWGDHPNLDAYMAKYDKLVKAEHDDSMRTAALSLRERMARATRNYADALDAAAEAERKRYEATPGVKEPGETEQHMKDWKKTTQEEFDLPLKLSREQTERQLKVLRGSMTRLDALKEQIKVQNPHAKPEEINKLANTQETYRLGEQYGSPINRFQLQKKDILKAVEGGIITKERAGLELRQAYTSLMGPSVGGQSTDIASYRGQLQSAITNAYNNQQLTPDEQRTMYQELIDLLKQGIPMRV